MLESVSEMGGSDTEALAKLVRSKAYIGMKVCEIGSWKGGSAETIGNIVKEYDGMLYCVDTWRGNVGVSHHDIAKTQDVQAIFVENMGRCGLTEYVIPIKEDSVVAAKIFDDGFFDVVFIDADHRYSNVKSDITAWMRKLKPNGILCGHDCEQHFRNLPEHFQLMMYDYLDSDMVGTYHTGVILALHEIFNDEYNIHFPSKVWSRIMN